jgi:cell division protein FtsQ
VAATRRAPPPRARAAVIPLPRASRVRSLPFLPSRRALLIGLGLVAVAVGSYVAARQSSAFAVTRIEVAGAPAGVRAQVRQTLAPLTGTSLLALDGAALERRVEALPSVVAARYDRAFPHTLRLTVVAETPVAVLRRGAEAWLLSARGRVVSRVRRPGANGLPRIWVPARTPVELGGFLAPEAGGTAARALAVAARFPARIAGATAQAGELVFRLRSGLELRLGAPTDVRLKLAVARRALPRLPRGATYLDVSVPGRPVAGVASVVSSGNPKVSTRG